MAKNTTTNPALSKWDKLHLKELEKYETRVRRIYEEAAREAAALGVSLKDAVDPSKPFTFDDYPQAKQKIDSLMTALAGDVQSCVESGIRSGWALANEKDDALCDRVFGKKNGLLTPELRKRYYSNNGDALEAFIGRKTKGLNLSDKVWKYTTAYKEEIELALDLGIRDGMSAAEMTKELRKYLQHPNMLFRRVRDEHGVLHLSKRAKAFHPSTGVYRSSYMNARRLAATETNIAYRTADHLRWQELDFVVGIRICMSNNHTCLGRDGKPHPFTDICDELSAPVGYTESEPRGKYPKDFKFTGWHPHCRCHAVAITESDDEAIENAKRIMRGEEPLHRSQNEVKDMPESFQNWLEENRARISRAKTPPYFLSDNYIDPRNPSDEGLAFRQKPMKVPRTEVEREAILQRWNERKQAIQHNETEARRAIDMARIYSENLDITAIEDLVERKQFLHIGKELERVQNELLRIEQEAKAMESIIPNAHSLLGRYNIETLKSNYDAVKMEFKAISKKRLLGQEKCLLDNIKYAANKIQEDAYKARLAIVQTDIKIEALTPQISAMSSVAAGGKLNSFKELATKATDALASRDVATAEDLLKRMQTIEPMAKRYDELAKYATTSKKYKTALDGAFDLLEKGDIAAAEAKLLEAEKLQSQFEAAKAYRAAKKAAEEEAKRQAALAKQGRSIAEAKDFDELKEIMGDDLPEMLKEYEKSIAREGLTKAEYLRERAEIERKLKEFFGEMDYGHWEHEHLLDERILDNGILNNFQTGSKSSGYDESRRSYAHFAYGLQGSRHTKVAAAKRLADKHYYRCGIPMPKDKTKAWTEIGGGGSYGNAHVRFRKDRVVATWTYGNSLQTDCIPSLVCDPKVVSIDKNTFTAKARGAAQYTSTKQILSGSYKSYLEFQYLPKKSTGSIMPRDIESIVLTKHPEKIHPKRIWDRWYEEGVDIYYWDGKKVALYRKGKPLETPEQMRSRLQAKAAARHAKRDAELAKKGLTPAERTRQLLDERTQLHTEARKYAEDFLAKEKTLANADISFAKLKERLAKGNSYGARAEAKAIEAEVKKLKKREDALLDLIPDAKVQHKLYTIVELEDAYKAIEAKLRFFEAKTQGDPLKYLEKTFFEVRYIEEPANQKHRTWHIARDAYARKHAEMSATHLTPLTDRLTELKGFEKPTAKIKGLLKEAEDMLAKGKYRDFKAKLDEANSAKLALEASRAAKTKGKVQKLGEALGVEFDEEAYSEARKKAAAWFKNARNPQKAFNEADAFMSRYAEDLWKQLTEEEKHVAYLYTQGSRYINEPFFTTYGAVKRSPIDGTIRNSRKDINALTTIIEKAKPLEHDMWVQHAEDMSAFTKRFGVRLGSVNADQIVGLEGVNDPFMSTSCAKHSYFTKQNLRPDMQVVMSIYLPKGTKGIYCEPFAHYGDGKLYGDVADRYGTQGFHWDGTSRQASGRAAGDQVEFLLQRGAKLRITKAEYKGGRWYIDCDLVEQKSVGAF